MKKFILIAFTVLAVCGASFGQTDADSYVIKTIGLTTTGTTTADATYTVPAGERLSLIGVYQGVTTQTNTCLVKRVLSGLTTSQAVQVESLSAVANTSAIENVGEGDVTADVDPIILTEGDVLWLDASGAAASNVVYKIIVKRNKQ